MLRTKHQKRTTSNQNLLKDKPKVFSMERFLYLAKKARATFKDEDLLPRRASYNT